MEQSNHFACDTPDCIHWKDGACTKASPITIQEHHCTDFEERITLSAGTITIEVSGGVVQSVYASPDLPEISVELIDHDSLEYSSEQEQAREERQLKMTEKYHNHIF